MDTEAVEELVAAPPPPNKDHSPIAKGKRTKRQRPHSPIPFSVETPTTTTAARDHGAAISATSSGESTSTEEEDTARCLILLAQGHFHTHPHDSKRKRQDETAAGACMYACKTCNRAFTSFQALGGHRASHKKEKKPAPNFSDEEDYPSPSSKKKMPPPSSLQLANISAANAAVAAAMKPIPSQRIHECSYCGAEFASGQALGGHMRRHRAGPISPPSIPAAASVEEPEESKKAGNRLSLDLNLPAPEDENQRFGFAPRQHRSPGKPILSTANKTPTLVDCHY